MMDASYCLCGQPYDPNIFMIQCDACKDWFHSSCCNFQEHLAIEIDKYHCPRCAPLFGPSVLKPFQNWHRHDFWDDNATEKAVQTGTAVFIRELMSRHFASEGDVVLHMRGQQITDTLLQQQGFNNPIVVDGKDGLDMTLPADNFSLYDIESYVGGDMEIDVIDVTRQSNIKMKLRDYVEYYNSLNRTRVFNVVSLEFSHTQLAPMVEAPLIARKLDWANNVWPRDYPVGRPQVQKYCLMSVKDSYTDFHIDFGGTSVWYHVLRGEKIFYFIRPTPANLTLYQQWMTSSNQSETFFGDQYNTNVRDQIPYTINPVQLLKEITREIRHAEKIINQLNPPKPERESKRKRKRPINRDFVDFSTPSKAMAPPPPSREETHKPPPPLRLTLPKPVTYPYERQRSNNHDRNGLNVDFKDEQDSFGSRPEQTTSVHRGRAVLKFKLGSRDILPQINTTDIPDHFGLVVGSSAKSIYDFHDESDRDEDCFNFTIDENPPPPKKSKKLGSLKVKFPVVKRGANNKRQVEIGDLPKNGIESLLKASALATGGEEGGRASPSTQDAIAGMLSIGQTCQVQPANEISFTSSRRYSGSSLPDEGNLNNVHQDEDYIYPSLDNSDDEDIHIFKPRGRSKVDEAWNPKARVGPLLPKTNRPAREGTKKEAVEKVLEAAAAKRANEEPEKPAKRQYRKKKIKRPLTTGSRDAIVKDSSPTPKSILSSPDSLNMTPTGLLAMVSVGTSSSSTSNLTISPLSSTPKSRKGMKTVKQRLGKILKIHKMMH